MATVRNFEVMSDIRVCYVGRICTYVMCSSKEEEDDDDYDDDDRYLRLQNVKSFVSIHIRSYGLPITNATNWSRS
jgi:hypothetical protein